MVLPNDSLTRAFNRDLSNIEAAKRDTDDTDIMDWFHTDAEIDATEEVVGLGEYGRTLTVVTPDIPDDDDDECDQEWAPFDSGSWLTNTNRPNADGFRQNLNDCKGRAVRIHQAMARHS